MRSSLSVGDFSPLNKREIFSIAFCFLINLNKLWFNQHNFIKGGAYMGEVEIILPIKNCPYAEHVFHRWAHIL